MKKIILFFSVTFILSTASSFSQTLQQVVDNGNSTATSITHTNNNGLTLKNNNIVDTTFNSLRIGQYGGSAQFLRYVPYSTGSATWDWNHDFYYDFTNTYWGVDGNFSVDGNLGNGTTTPSTKLHVVDNINAEVLRVESSTNSTQIKLRSTGSGGIDWSLMSTANGSSLGGGNFSIYGNAQHRLVLDQNGQLGIGTTSPAAKLHIEEGALQFFNAGVNQDDVDIIKIGEGATTDQFTLTGMFAGYGEDGNAIKFTSMWNDNLMFIRGNGNIGIGTTDPTNKLEVNGTIRSKEVIVEATGWPDYVFLPEYDLLSLEELEEYITTNRHLPEVPSEAEVLESGVKLGEMDATLLQKIEELTLYVIEQNKLNKEQQGRIQKLEEANAELLKKLEDK